MSVKQEEKPKAKCLGCGWTDDLERFIGEEEGDDKCPICKTGHWEIV